MPVPKNRRSKSKKRMKQVAWKLEAPELRPCPRCGALGRSHFACQECGFYKDVQVIEFKIKDKSKKDE